MAKAISAGTGFQDRKKGWCACYQRAAQQALAAILKNATIAAIPKNPIIPVATATALRASKKTNWSGWTNV